MGRSNEEKGKCHSGAIYRGPLMLYTNYLGSSRFLQEDFQDFPILHYISQLCPQTGPHFYTRGIIWTFFLATNQNHFNNFCRGPGISPVWSNSHKCGSREDVVSCSPYLIQCKIVTPGRGQFWPQGHNLNNFGRWPLDKLAVQKNNSF